MKERIIGSAIVLIVLVVLYILTGGDISPQQQTQQPQVTQPQTKFNF
jgi:hypothetical protein